MTAQNRKLLLDVPDVMATTGLSRQAVYDLLNAGKIRSIKAGRRRLIPAAALDDWIADALRTGTAG